MIDFPRRIRISRLTRRYRVTVLTALLRLVILAVTLIGVEQLPLSRSAVNAQPGSATLIVSVSDPSAALVPGVKITLLNLATALQRHGTTDDQGSCVVPLLPPGKYNITAQRKGFTSLEIRNVVLNTGDHVAYRVKLTIAEVGESVTVIDSASSIQQSAAVGTVVDRNFVENLPLNGRSFQSLFELTPGVVLTRATFNEQGQFSVNGQRANANYFMVDGVSANIGVSAGAAPGQSAAGSLPALTVLGSTNNLVSVDALEEFRILTSSYAPEFGRTPGAQISIATRSGTNKFSGTAFAYLRNDALDANDWFANSRGLRRAAIRQNNFGGVLGGPIDKDRAFFFFSYEGLRLRQPQVAVTEVPSLSARLIAPPGAGVFLKAFPIPNGPETHNGLAQFAASYSDPSRSDSTSLRIDVAANERLWIFGRFNYSVSGTTQRGRTIFPGFSVQAVVNPSIGQSLNNLTRAEVDTTTATFAVTYAFSAKTLNDLRLNWSRVRGATAFSIDDFGGAVPPPPSLLFPSSVPLSDAGFQFLLRGGTNTALVAGRNVDNLQRQINVVDSLTLIRGSHQLRMGIDYRRLTPVYNSLGYNQSVVYDGVTRIGGSTAGTVLSGIAESVQVFVGAGPRFPVFTNFSAYAQDTNRIRPRMTLTYGVRWDFNPPPSESRGNSAIAVQGLERPSTLTLAPRGTQLWKSTYGNFAPRLGLVYQISTTPGRELLLRTGFGVFYDLGNGQAAQGFGSVFPFVGVKRFTNVPYPLTPEQALPPSLNLDPPFGTIVAFDPELQLPRTYQWNVALEKSLTSDQTLSLAYVGAVGRRLLREDVLINPEPNFTIVRVTRNAARSNYHALQLQYRRRLYRGFQALASYTASRSLDNASSDSLPRLRVVPAGQVSGILGEQDVPLAPSDFDVRHSLAAAVTYNLPKPHGNNVLLRNWVIDGVLRVRSATPVNVVTRSDVVGDQLVLELQRPDLVPGVPLYLKDHTVAGGRRINRDAFTVPAESRQGNLPYNALRGFAVSQVDLALHRQFVLGEYLKLQVKADVFNVFNHPNFGNPINTLDNSLFGQSLQMLNRSLGSGGINGGLSPVYQIGGPRSIQLALRLQF
ncbi:MAG TPA: carboxypeptidase regulatory-like domain-containing protein [Pyrinomonadaceae bacterium]|nr:carboxypeptidase regulatory-like domain-containing protein [Pyrinomonadaceae bacterium]